ncbi:CAAX protease self-immunity [Lachnospiraceae bacterium NE2001]|nr:CAAX protease self-immunity [Lachnospiraceae bacterium NE2001]
MLLVSLHAINVKTVEYILGETAKFGNGYISTKTLIAITIIVSIIFIKKGLIEVDFSVIRPHKNIKKELIISLILSVLLMLVLIVIRQVLQHFKPEISDRPFFAFYFMYHTRWFYPVNAFLQEMFIRIAIQDNLKKLEDEHTRYMSLLLVGCFFASLHMAYPWYMMIGTALYCMVSGYFYDRYRCFWGLTILHFVGGFFPRCFGII